MLNTDLCLVMTNTAELWILNKSGAKCDVGPGELCGFNVGAFSEKPAGRVRQNLSKVVHNKVVNKEIDCIPSKNN